MSQQADMVAVRFDDVVLGAVWQLARMYPEVPLPDLFDSVVENLEVAASEGVVRLFGPWVVIG